SLIKAASNLEIRLHDLSPSQTPVEIQSILGTVEDGAETLRQQIASDGSAIVSEEAQKLGAMLDSVEQTVQIWRQEYPDTSPVKINNRKCFFDPAADKNTPTVIAYCITLVARVFERTAQCGATFLLKMLKLFGYSFATLGGRSLSREQEAVLASIPESIERLEKKFNLDIECVPYAVCPKCSCTYTPSYPNNTPNPVYPPLCLERKAASENPCNEPLLSHGKPLKIFEYYPFFDWFGNFISLPRIEEYGDKFCENIDKHLIVPLNKVHQTGGRFVHEFCGVDGQPFIAGQGNEGRWFFTLNADFFNVEGNRIHGKTSLTGMMAMSCLNLPLNIRNDHAYLYIPGIIQGPHEPNAVDAEYRHYLKPLIDDFLVGYTRGVRPYATHRTHRSSSYPRVFRLALALALMDFKAARPFAGFLDVTLHHFCYICDCWHNSHLGRTDYENWQPIDDEFLRKGAELWRDAAEVKLRKAIEDLFGTRSSELWRLPYWQASCQLGVDPMHIFFLILMQRYFRDILGLDNPDEPKKTPEKPRFRFAFYHEFTPPPSLSSLAANSSGSQEDVFHSATHIGNIHRLLQQPLVSGQEDLHKALKQSNGDALAYVCTDIERLPVDKFAKDNMVNQLILWRMSKPLEQMQSIKIDSSGLLQRVQQVIHEVITPAWVKSPPADVGLSKAGTLKAEHWRTLFSIHTSPLASASASSMTSVVDTTMHLTCASLVMTKRTLSLERRNLFCHLLRLHVAGLKQDFPGWIFPTHHLAFHIFDGMEYFSGVRNWWNFPFENLIGKLQRIPINHIIGKFECTMHHSFCEGANFRQWLLRSNSPPMLRYCQQLMDKAYNFNHELPATPEDDVDDSVPDLPTVPELVENNFAQPDSRYIIPPPSNLKKLLGAVPSECFSRIPGSKGDYTIPGEGALGNHYICFQPEGVYHPGQRWLAGQIRHIFRQTQKGPIKLAIQRSLSTTALHPFGDFWANGFEADMVSSEFSSNLEIVNLNQVAGHSARWAISDNQVVVVSLCSVSVLYSDKFFIDKSTRIELKHYAVICMRRVNSL
ncbi:hypothetical protein F5051DRAFT_341426, partial [Lentinula edodes]